MAPEGGPDLLGRAPAQFGMAQRSRGTPVDGDVPAVEELEELLGEQDGALDVGVAAHAGDGDQIEPRVGEGQRVKLRGYARDIGLAFQIADDIMDVEGDEALAGKALHKDEAAGKATFVTLMGLERARDQATLLVEQAIAHLGGFGEEAALLRAIARYVVERDR